MVLRMLCMRHPTQVSSEGWVLAELVEFDICVFAVIAGADAM